MVARIPASAREPREQAGEDLCSGWCPFGFDSSRSSSLIPAYASSSKDENAVSRFVCCHVRPLRAARLLESPRQAARFVSCIPFERSRSLGSGPSEQWSSTHALLAANSGDVEDHALLLCSLLLGELTQRVELFVFLLAF